YRQPGNDGAASRGPTAAATTVAAVSRGPTVAAAIVISAIAAAAGASAAAIAVAEGRGNMRVLLVEDDKELQRLLRKALADAGYVVDSAFDGEEGYFLGDTEPYDAVVLDLGLPKMDGVSVLEKWRKSGKMMPVLILTARDSWSDKVAGFDAGADDYLAKPFVTE